MKMRNTISILVSTAALAGCAAGFHVVSETKTGGELALEGSRESAMEKARVEMSRVCGGDKSYDVVEEGEVGYGGAPVPAGTDPHEWRVHYACKSAEKSPGNPALADAGTD